MFKYLSFFAFSASLLCTFVLNATVNEIKIGVPVVQKIQVNYSSASDSRYSSFSQRLETFLVPLEVNEQEMHFEATYTDVLHDYYYENDNLFYSETEHLDSREPPNKNSSKKLLETWQQITETTDFLVAVPGNISSSTPKNSTFQTYGSDSFYQGIFGAWQHIQGKTFNSGDSFVVEVQESSAALPETWEYHVDRIDDTNIFYSVNVKQGDGVYLGRGSGYWVKENILKGQFLLQLKFGRTTWKLNFISQ